MESTKDKVELVTANMFATVLELDVHVDDSVVKAASSESYLTSSVQINGHWDGVVSICLPEKLANKCASIMFDLPEGEAEQEDIEDAIGEMANMTSGSFKSMLDGQCQLGLPVVTNGADYVVRFPGSVLDCEVGFRCGEDTFQVSVMKRTDE